MEKIKLLYKYKRNDKSELVTIYDIRPDKNGYPHFLIYYDNQWMYVSAKNFSPVTTDYLIDCMVDEFSKK